VVGFICTIDVLIKLKENSRQPPWKEAKLRL